MAMSFNIYVTCLSDQMLILSQYCDAREALDVSAYLTKPSKADWYSSVGMSSMEVLARAG